MFTFSKTKSRLGNECSRAALGTVLLLVSAGAASAQDAAGGEQVEQVTVTGTRLSSGFTTPTPVTTVSAAQLSDTSPNNIADALMELPAFQNSLPSTVPSTAATTGTNGQSNLNLRNLNSNRTLVLLDGRRVVPSNSTNTVDINILPQNLVSRVDVVTGGASAAYGSDAVAGVVNFVLNTNFEGLKGEIGGGISTHNDMGSWKGDLAGGTSFFGGRLRIIASTSNFTQNGIPANQLTGRKWFDVAPGLIPPVPASPPYKNVLVPDIRASIGSNGGLITTAGALANTTFQPGGVPVPFNTGQNFGTAFQSGGDGSRVNIGFAPDQWHTSNFSHVEFDAAPNVTLYGEAMYAYSFASDGNEVDPQDGTRFAATIFSGNPFIPASIQTTMTANKITSFSLGRYLSDFPIVTIINSERVARFVVGAKGDDPFFGTDWHYDLSYSSGQTRLIDSQNNLPIDRNFYAATDAVVNPNTGSIACRSTIFNAAGTFVAGGTGEDPGCQPLNLFGQGSPSKAAIAYTIGNSGYVLRLNEEVAQINLSGDLGERLSFGAGPISIATGFEHRQDSANQSTDAISQSTPDYTGLRGIPSSAVGVQGGFRFFNPLPFAGSFNVDEEYAEIGVPLLKDQPFAKSLNVDLAARRTDYSISGLVTTWKYGLNYQIDDDIRLRGTVSQDIRAPNLLELFNAATQNGANPVFRGVSTPALLINSGNPNLKPESALTYTYGAVYQPSWLEGFSISADYYDIKMKGAIGAPAQQTILDQCSAGVALYCAQIIVQANGSIIVHTSQINLQAKEVAGIDFEASYNTELFDNPLQFRMLASHDTKNYTIVPGQGFTQGLNSADSPSWRANLQARYSFDDWSIFLQERYISEAQVDPAGTNGIPYLTNLVPHIFYTDLTFNYNLEAFGTTDQLYLSASNLFDQNPPIDPPLPTSFSQPTDGGAYDRIGRYINAGIRFKF